MGRGKRHERAGREYLLSAIHAEGELELAHTEYGLVTAKVVELSGERRVLLRLDGAELAKLPLETALAESGALIEDDGSMVLVGPTGSDSSGRRVSPRVRLSKANRGRLRDWLLTGRTTAPDGPRLRPSALSV